MQFRGSIVRVFAAVAMVSGVVFVVTAPTASAASGDTSICYVNGNGVALGCAVWHAYGEHLLSCDYSSDGHAVYAEIKHTWSTGTQLATPTKDVNGAQSGCTDRNLSLAEMDSIEIRVHIGGVGYSGWIKGHA